MIRALHISDIHAKVGMKYAGKLMLDPATGYSVGFTDCQNGLNACLSWEAENPCDIAIISGDVFDCPYPEPAEYDMIGRFVINLLNRMPVIIISGNHDQDPHSTGCTAIEPLRALGEVHKKTTSPHALHVMTQPGSALVQTGKGKVYVAGLPYPNKSRFKGSGAIDTTASPEATLAKMNEALVDLVRGMNGGLFEDCPNIMVAHGSVSGAKVGEQPRSIAHDLFLPIREMELYDAVFLGHIHKHQMVSGNAFYAGSLLCGSFGEMGEKKGWCVVEIEKAKDPVVTHIQNPHSRTFIDIDIENQAYPFANWESEGVFRFRGTVSRADHTEYCLRIAKFEQTHPFTLNDLTIEQGEVRSRDEGMTAMLSEDEAVERTLQGMMEADKVPNVMARHYELMGEANKS